MLNSMRPPTDNLYKFAAIFGLVLIGFGVWLLNAQNNKGIDAQLAASDVLQETWIDIYENEDLRTLLQDQMQHVRAGETIYGLSLEASEIDGVTAEQVESVRRFEIAGQKASNTITIANFYVWPIVSFWMLGIIFSIYGFLCWRYRVQKYEDIILRKQAEEEAPAEVEDGPANAYRKWEADEVEQLRTGFKSKKSLKTLAKEHGRSRGAIRSRLIKIGLIDDPWAKP